MGDPEWFEGLDVVNPPIGDIGKRERGQSGLIGMADPLDQRQIIDLFGGKISRRLSPASTVEDRPDAIQMTPHRDAVDHIKGAEMVELTVDFVQTQLDVQRHGIPSDRTP